MKKLADTISYAITIYVIEILRFNKKFYVVIEDLSPTLNKDLSFIRKAYSDALGDLIYEAGFGTYSTTEEKQNR